MHNDDDGNILYSFYHNYVWRVKQLLQCSKSSQILDRMVFLHLSLPNSIKKSQMFDYYTDFEL